MKTEVKITVIGGNIMKSKSTSFPYSQSTDTGKPFLFLTLVILVLPPQLYYV